jgi:hypothetical protein
VQVQFSVHKLSFDVANQPIILLYLFMEYVSSKLPFLFMEYVSAELPFLFMEYVFVQPPSH